MGHSIIQIHLELVNLLLKKSNHCVALHYLSTMLQNQKLKLCNGVISPSNNLIKPLILSLSNEDLAGKSRPSLSPDPYASAEEPDSGTVHSYT